MIFYQLFSRILFFDSAGCSLESRPIFVGAVGDSFLGRIRGDGPVR